MSTLTATAIYGYATGAGFTPTQAVVATAVALAESGGRTTARNNNPPLEDSRGLWQINVLAHSQFAGWNLYDPATNAKAAYAVSNEGRNFGPWSTYKPSSAYPKNNNAYASHLDTAEAVKGAPQIKGNVALDGTSTLPPGALGTAQGTVSIGLVQGTSDALKSAVKSVTGWEQGVVAIGEFFAGLGTLLFNPLGWRRMGVGIIGVGMVATGVHLLISPETLGAAGSGAALAKGGAGAGEATGGTIAKLATEGAAVA